MKDKKLKKKATWIEDGYSNGEMVCSNCGCEAYHIENVEGITYLLEPYCRKCGAEMENRLGNLWMTRKTLRKNENS